jgi:hypothetical protein
MIISFVKYKIGIYAKKYDLGQNVMEAVWTNNLEKFSRQILQTIYLDIPQRREGAELRSAAGCLPDTVGIAHQSEPVATAVAYLAVATRWTCLEPKSSCARHLG